MHANYYMMEGTPHVWPINVHGTSLVAINVHGTSLEAINVYGNYYMVEGTPQGVAN